MKKVFLEVALVAINNRERADMKGKRKGKRSEPFVIIQARLRAEKEEQAKKDRRERSAASLTGGEGKQAANAAA
ncbi:MAG: hypothetical protein ABH881_00400 [bacterium]